ncbi:MAG TPA: YbgF trimerization domain-containing protein [Acidocella sp.]|nr:YbgF trimerization domain-containing protein [Acidocella sp.]
MRKSLFAPVLFSSALFLLPAAEALLPAAAWAQPMVQSQEGIALQNEIDQLQSQVQQLQSASQNNGGSALGGNAAPPPAQSSGGGAPVAGGMVANLLNQVQQLQSQVQQLSGQVDELQNQVNQQNAQTQKQIGDLNFRVTGSATPGGAPGTPPAGGAVPGQPQSLTPPSAAAPVPATPAPTPTPTTAPVSSGDPKSQLHAALTAYQAHDYKTSASLASSLVKNSSQAPEAYRAQYLVAQSYSATGDNQDAAIAYDNTYNMNRTGAYAPQALLGLASSLAGIGANDEACSTLSSLNSQFPTPPAGMQPRIDAVSKKANCQ